VTYTLKFRPKATRQFRKLPQEIQDRLEPHIEALKQDPRPPGAEKITGSKDTYRLRVGNYRVIYEVYDTYLLVSVILLGHRREIYRQL